MRWAHPDIERRDHHVTDWQDEHPDRRRDRGARRLAGGGEYGELLLPRRQLPEGVAEESEVSVFLYLDADCEPVITTDKPFAMVGTSSVSRWSMPTRLVPSSTGA